MVVEEFGKALPRGAALSQLNSSLGDRMDPTPVVRNSFFETVYKEVEDSARAGGSGASNFWCVIFT